MNQIIVTAIETNDRKQTEIALAESEAKYRRLVEDANDAISTWGLDGVLTYISPGMKIIFGYDPSEWLGKSFVPLVHPDDLQICMSANQQVIETGEKRSGVEFRNRHNDGHWVWVSMNISPVKDTDGKVIAFQGILRDISDRKQQENALRFIVEGTVSKTGAAFFYACVQNLAEIFEVQYAFITELVDETFNQSRMLALWTGKGFVEPYEFDLAGTPCSTVFQEKWGIFPDALQARFPEADALATLRAESYLGVVIVDSQGKAIGNLGIMNTKPLTDNINTTKFILQIFAARVGAEMERYAAEVKLQEKEQFLRTVYEGANQPIFVIDVLPDGDFRYVGWNAAAEAASGMCSQDIRGKSPEEIYGIEVGKLERQRLQECLVSKQSVSYEECLNFDEKKSWWITTHNPIQDSNGRVYRFIGTTFNISDRKCAEAQLTQRKAELEQTLQELRRTQAQMIQAEKMSGLGQLVAGVAHEINNPVNFIYGNLNHTDTYIQDLLELLELYQQHYPTPHPDIQQQAKKIDLEFLTTDLPKLLTSMKVGANRIEKIVASLRNFSRMDEAEMKEVNIHDGINSTLMILQYRLKGKSNFPEIQVIKNYGELPLIECYAGKLNQVFMNLIGNAIDALEEAFTADKNTIPTITINTFLANLHEVVIQITDNGLGIPNHIQERIFDPFFTTKPIGKGTGMGLSISYQIVTEKHKGTLQCVSKMEQQGTTFIATIPTRQT